jgi:hypothetical protein
MLSIFARMVSMWKLSNRKTWLRYDCVPGVMEGCHTIVVDGYVVEGHVSADIIKRLLRDRPTGVRGISIPGMPAGVPGMPGERDHPLDVYAFGSGKPTLYTQQP